MSHHHPQQRLDDFGFPLGPDDEFFEDEPVPPLPPPPPIEQSPPRSILRTPTTRGTPGRSGSRRTMSSSGGGSSEDDGEVEGEGGTPPPPSTPPPPATTAQLHPATPDRSRSSGSSSPGGTARTEPLGTPSTLGSYVSGSRSHGRTHSRTSSGFSIDEVDAVGNLADDDLAFPRSIKGGGDEAASFATARAAAAPRPAAKAQHPGDAASASPAGGDPDRIAPLAQTPSALSSGSASASVAPSAYASARASASHRCSESSASTALIGLVKQQAELVKNLTDANRGASEELRRVQEEKRRMEEELAKTREDLERKRRAGNLSRPGAYSEFGGTPPPGAGFGGAAAARAGGAGAARPASPDPFGIGSAPLSSPVSDGGAVSAAAAVSATSWPSFVKHDATIAAIPPERSSPPAAAAAAATGSAASSSAGAVSAAAASAASGAAAEEASSCAASAATPTAANNNGGQLQPRQQGREQEQQQSQSQRVVFDEWSTVVYPGAAGGMIAATTAVATPVPVDEHMMVDEHGFAIEEEPRTGSRKKKKRKGSRKKRKGGSAADGTMKRSSVTVQPKKPKTIPLASTDCAPPLKIPTKEPTCSSRFWANLSRACTCCIPDAFICRTGPRAKQAWREKVTICLLAAAISAFFVGVFGFVPLFFCTEQSIYTWEDIHARNAGVLSIHKNMWTVVHGKIYDVEEFAGRHPGGSDGVNKWVGEDASKMFPRIPADQLPTWCLNPRIKPINLTEYTKAACVDFNDLDELTELPCHNMSSTMIGPEGIRSYLGRYLKGDLAHSHRDLTQNTLGFDWIVIRDRVYNVSAYTRNMRHPETGRIISSSPNGFLNHRLNKLVVNKIHSDATEVFEEMYPPEVTDSYLQCLEDLYFAGVVDNRDDPVCYALNIIMYVILILVLLILVLQFVCSLLYVARSSKTLTAEMEKARVMVMIPAYNEGDRELGKTIKSVVEADYPDENKVLLIVCDGLITGRGEELSTPETVAKYLGYKMDAENDRTHSYRSIGAATRNKAYVYHGTYLQDNRELRYIVVVKCGTSKERPSPRAGNRGKRDSQLLFLGALNRIHYGRELCELDVAICRALNDLDLSVEDVKYLMTIDADTRVHRDSVARMVFSMEREDSQLACSGETRVDNKASSLVSMIQVYEYFSSHHMKKAFESVFGCVTCLPGCFTMYRIHSADDRPLLACDNVFAEYSRNDIESLHEKNLYHLGEDRMLTTLLLKYFPDMKLSFVPEAVCWTIVPHTFRVLLSQRRRWINSTFHNMWELLKIEGLCGVCIFSMKTVVLADMIATMILPASFLYAAYFIYKVFAQGTAMSETLLIIYGVIIGCQMLVFLIRSRWDYLFWFLAYLVLGLPVFFFVLPVYSFWNMDDLSWGQTRRVAAEREKAASVSEMASPTAASAAAAAAAAAETEQQGQRDDGKGEEGADPELGGARSDPAPEQAPRREDSPRRASAPEQAPAQREEAPRPKDHHRSVSMPPRTEPDLPPASSPRASPSASRKRPENGDGVGRRRSEPMAARRGGGSGSPRSSTKRSSSKSMDSRRHSSAPEAGREERMLAVV